MHRILFAHGDDKLSQIYVNHLKNYFLVDSVHDGLSALRRLKISMPSLVLSEFNLPILSGIAVLKFVRKTPDYSHIPFLFLSDHHDNSEALSRGANDWIEINSCQPDYLLDRIHHHIKTNKYGIQIHRA